jgi:hypothetical protein
MNVQRSEKLYFIGHLKSFSSEKEFGGRNWYQSIGLNLSCSRQYLHNNFNLQSLPAGYSVAEPWHFGTVPYGSVSGDLYI